MQPCNLTIQPSSPIPNSKSQNQRVGTKFTWACEIGKPKRNEKTLIEERSMLQCKMRKGLKTETQNQFHISFGSVNRGERKRAELNWNKPQTQRSKGTEGHLVKNEQGGECHENKAQQIQKRPKFWKNKERAEDRNPPPVPIKREEQRKNIIFSHQARWQKKGLQRQKRRQHRYNWSFLFGSWYFKFLKIGYWQGEIQDWDFSFKLIHLLSPILHSKPFLVYTTKVFACFQERSRCFC